MVEFFVAEVFGIIFGWGLSRSYTGLASDLEILDFGSFPWSFFVPFLDVIVGSELGQSWVRVGSELGQSWVRVGLELG